MAGDRIAHGEVEVTVNDRDAIARLEEIRAAWKRTMDSIDRDKATATIDADIKPLEEGLAQAKREVRRLKGEKAEVELGIQDGDEAELAAAIKEAQAQVRRLDGEKAIVEIETRGAAKAIAEQEAVAKAEEKRRKAAAQNAKADRAQIALNDRLAYSMASRRSEIAKLQQAYKKQSDELERLNKKRPIGREERINVEINSARAIGEMERLKFLLNKLGKYPPVEIEPKVNRRGFQRVTGAFGDMISNIGRKAAGLSDLTVRLGPFTTTIRQLAVALSFLGPILVDVGGAATALVGVLGTGITGAASVAGGVIAGLGLNFAGMLYTMRPIKQDFQIAMTATNAYTKAVDKFGKNSTQAQKAHAQMVSAMKAIDPNARKAIVTLAHLRKEWQKEVGPTAKRDLGSMIKEGANAIRAIMPAAAQNTKRSFTIMKDAVKSWSKGIQSAEGVNIFKSLGESANEFLAPALDGLGHLGAALGRVAESAARLFAGPAGQGFRDWAAGFDESTKNGSKLDATMRRLGQHAADVIHFFGALGRLLVTVFNGGADAGDSLVRTMTKAMNRWSDFLQTSEGHNAMLDFFDRAIHGTEALYAAFAPLITAFVRWASYLAPAAAMFFRGAAFVADFIAQITKLVGLGGSVSAFAATLGALWAIGKIGAFVSMLARAVELVRELGALGTAKALATGSFFGQLKRGGPLAAGGAEAGAAMEAGAARAAAELRAGGVAAGAAVSRGGAARVAESAAVSRGGVILPGGAAASVERTGASAGRAAGAFSKLKSGAAGALLALTGLTPVGALAVASLGAVAYGVWKVTHNVSQVGPAAKRFNSDLKNLGAAGDEAKNAIGGLQGTSISYRESLLDEKDAHKQVLDMQKQGLTGTNDYKRAVLSWRQAQLQANEALNGYKINLQHAQSGVDKQVKSSKALLDQRTHERDMFKVGTDSWNNYNKAVQDANKTYQATLNRQAALSISFDRVRVGLSALTGAAEQAVGALARVKGGAPIAKKIALKFDDPGQVQRVASAASRTLKTGVPSRVVTKIVADSKNAEDAIKRINRAKITPHKLDIIEHGGKSAIRTLEGIIGRKLTPKEQRIAQKGGPAVVALLNKILGTHLQTKTQHIAQTGAQGVKKALDTIAKTFLPPKRQTVTTNANGILNALHSLATFHLPDLHQNIIQTKKKNAAGRRRGVSGASWIGEGSNWQGATEYIANSKTGAVTKVDSPTVMKLDPSDAVIPTEPRYRDRGRDILKSIARDLGMEGFAKGRKHHAQHAATPAQISSAHRGARSTVAGIKKKHPVNISVDDLDRNVKAKQRDEANWGEQVQREVNRIEAQEPSTFLVQTGTNPVTGDPIYAEDTGAIQRWSDQLRYLGGLFDQLVTKIYATLTAVTDAMSKIGDPHAADNPIGTIVGTAQFNIREINKQVAKQNHIIANKHASKKEVGMAKERLRVYNEELGNQRSIIKDSQSDWDSLDDEKNAIGTEGTRGRLADARDSSNQYKSDADAIQGKADTELAGTQPKVTPEIADPFATANNRISALDAEAALAQIGEGIAGAGPRSIEDINKDIIGTNQGIIDQANAMLRDNDTSNDQAAYQAIQSAAGAIQGLSGSAGSPGFSAGQLLASSTARQELYSAFGSNFALASGFGAVGSAMGAFGTNSAFSAMGAPAGGGGDTNVSVVNNFPTPPPDPHTWSQGTLFELQAAI